MNRLQGPYIPAALDDLGLPPAAFRVVCRIARRGKCHESMVSMEQGCRLSRKSIREAIAGLLACGVIHVTGRRGRGKVYELTAPVLWRKWDQRRKFEFEKTTNEFLSRYRARFSEAVNRC